MTEFRKFALFQLLVLWLAAIAVTVIFALTDNLMASLAGFAVLALLGLRRVIMPGSPRSPVVDERDQSIQNRATVTGHVALWLALVAWGVAMPLIFGDRGSVPLVWVTPVVPVAWWLLTCVQSLTILALDGRDS